MKVQSKEENLLIDNINNYLSTPPNRLIYKLLFYSFMKAIRKCIIVFLACNYSSKTLNVLHDSLVFIVLHLTLAIYKEMAFLVKEATNNKYNFLTSFIVYLSNDLLC